MDSSNNNSLHDKSDSKIVSKSQPKNNQKNNNNQNPEQNNQENGNPQKNDDPLMEYISSSREITQSEINEAPLLILDEDLWLALIGLTSFFWVVEIWVMSLKIVPFKLSE